MTSGGERSPECPAKRLKAIGPARRAVLGFAAATAATLSALPLRAVHADEGDRIRFGVTPVLLSDDLDLLAGLSGYLQGATELPTHITTRRTYQEITTLLLANELDGAWICGYPFVRHRDALDLLAVPVWRGRPLYQSYIIVPVDRTAASVENLRGDTHAFSDPESNSGYLVTRALLATMGVRPDVFFRYTFFTYGHRNVVRAVASGLAGSGSVDGYVWEVMTEVDPGLTQRTRVLHKSDWHGFPPIACPRPLANTPRVQRLREALLTMPDTEAGRQMLATLRLDSFAPGYPSLFDSIAANMALVEHFG